jgi:hypothetical protein
MELNFNDLEGPYGDAHPAARVEHADVLISIRDADDARSYVEHTLGLASAAERISIYRALFGISAKAIASRRRSKNRAQTQQGGYDTGSTCLHDFLMLVDSLHDFGDEEFCSIVEDAFSYVKTPAGLHHARDERFVIAFLTNPRRKVLRFGDVQEANVLCGRNMLDKYDFRKLASDVGFDSAFESQRASAISKLHAGARVVPCDVWTEYVPATRIPSARLQVIKLEQIARLCGVMHRMFGGQRRCTFVTDNSDNQLVRIVFATHLVRQALFDKFAFDNDIFDDATLVNNMRAIVAREGFAEWRSCICDANIMDGASHSSDLEVDPRPTGPVYRPHLPFQVTLNGSASGTSTSVHWQDGETTKTYNVKANRSLFSTSAISYKILDIASGDTHNSTVAGQLALKRACDWGQVEHCRKYGMVFVSSDKLAVLYALFRGVKSVLLRRTEHRASGRMPEMLQYTFAICR